MKHSLPELPYSKEALQPVISSETLEFHHGKHHKAYVDKLNQLIPGTEFESMSLEEIVMKSSGPVFNNAGQIWNHNFYWGSLTPHANKKPEGELLSAIQKHFGTFEQFQERFAQAAVGQFGSGWAWLALKKDGSLTLETTSNAENPLRAGNTPLLTVDVWEHAYYIDYRNERLRYVQSLWGILNWDFAQANFAKAKK